MKTKNIISLQNFTPKEIDDLLYLSKQVKGNQKKYLNVLRGKTLGLLFNKPSTRTRVSFEAGMHALGGNTVFLSENEIQLGRGESIADTAKVLSRYIHGIVIRTYGHNILLEFAKNSSIPVINGLTDLLHPCQILADIFTIKEKKKMVKGLNLAYIGDGANNMAHSWLLAAGKVGLNIKIASPAQYKPHEEILKLATQNIREHNQGTLEISSDPHAAVQNADIIYTDVWASMGQEKEREERIPHFKPYQINRSLVEEAKPDALIMHCLPAHQGEEITEEMLYSPQSIIFDQAENRMHLQKALLIKLMS